MYSIYMYVSVCVCMYAWQYLTSGGPIALAKSTVGEKADMANPSRAFVHSFINMIEIQTSLCTNTHILTHTYIRKYVWTNMHAFIHTYINMPLSTLNLKVVVELP